MSDDDDDNEDDRDEEDTNKYHCYIPRLSLNKTSTVIGWFLVMCP